MNIQFYATEVDFADLLQFIWSHVPGGFFEAYSDCERPVRRFGSSEEMIAYLNGSDAGRQIAFCLQQAMPLLTKRPIGTSNSEAISRYAIGGWGVFWLNFEEVDRPYRRPPPEDAHKHYAKWPYKLSSVSVNSRARAVKWSDTISEPVDHWPWREIESAGRRIERYIRKNSVARGWDNQCQLAGAAAVIKSGPSYMGEGA